MCSTEVRVKINDKDSKLFDTIANLRDSIYVISICDLTKFKFAYEALGWAQDKC